MFIRGDVFYFSLLEKLEKDEIIAKYTSYVFY